MRDIQIVRGARKTMSIQITRDQTVIVRAPKAVPDSVIQSFVAKKSNWIEKTLEKMRADKAAAEGQQLSIEEVRRLKARARDILQKRLSFFAPMVGVQYGRVAIRSQRTRWGSCSGKGNLNFNCLLILCPPEVMDYVVVHELCHLKELNHSPAFWREVERVFPDYKRARRWLKTNGGALIQRLG